MCIQLKVKEKIMKKLAIKNAHVCMCDTHM